MIAPHLEDLLPVPILDGHTVVHSNIEFEPAERLRELVVVFKALNKDNGHLHGIHPTLKEGRGEGCFSL